MRRNHPVDVLHGVLHHAKPAAKPVARSQNGFGDAKAECMTAATCRSSHLHELAALIFSKKSNYFVRDFLDRRR
jgi:hypothetical protein